MHFKGELVLILGGRNSGILLYMVKTYIVGACQNHLSELPTVYVLRKNKKNNVYPSPTPLFPI